jgi:hypothetical protein
MKDINWHLVWLYAVLTAITIIGIIVLIEFTPDTP